MQQQPGGAPVVPTAQWGEVLSEFSEGHKGSPLSVRVVEPDGQVRSLDGSSPNDAPHVELRLISLGSEDCEGERIVRLFAHKHPGAQIAHIEFSGAVDLVRQDESFSFVADDGCRLEVRVSGPIRIDRVGDNRRH